MGISLNQEEINSDLLRLFEDFLTSFRKQTKKSKASSDYEIETAIILQLIKMNGNNRSKIFSSGASWINPKNSDVLLEQRLIQSIPTENGEKYSLSLSGIAECIKIKSKISLEQQYASFLQSADKDFNKTEGAQLDWREKLATISLILLASTSESSAIKLVNNQNQTVLMEVFQEVLSCMKKYHLAEDKDDLKPSSRGENPVAGHFARLDTLPRRTNHYYYGKEYIYYFAIEKDQSVDSEKLSFLLKRCFEGYDETVNYNEMYQELSKISQKYSPRFLGRTINPGSILNILGQIREFLDTEIYHLRPKRNLPID